MQTKPPNLDTFSDIHFINTCASTHSLLRERFHQGLAHAGSVLVCLDQRSGYGRLGRQWFSPPGNLALSLICPVMNWNSAYQLNLIAAHSLTQVIQKHTTLSPRIKWPNDVLIGDKKIAGILSEALPTHQVAFIGLGLNLNTVTTDFPLDLQPFLTTLKQECHQEFVAQTIIDSFLMELFSALTEYEKNGFAFFHKAISTILAYRDTVIEVCESGGLSFRATLLRLNEQGFLVVKMEDGAEKVLIAADIKKNGSSSC